MDGGVRPWQALAQYPLRFLGSSAPWRAWLYTATGAPLGLVTLVVLAILATAGAGLSVIGVGLALLTVAGLVGIPVGTIERLRLRLLGIEVPSSPHRTLRGLGWRSWLRTRFREPATWRELAFALLLATGLWFIDVAAAALPVVSLLLLPTPLEYALGIDPESALFLGTRPQSLGTALAAAGAAVLLLVASAYLVTAAAGMHVKAVHVLLTGADTDQLDPPTMELVRSNGHLLDAFDAERQRIERDLHDGAQQRLVALTVMLDVARMRAEDAGLGGEMPALLSRAHQEAITTLSGLRELVRGIHPRVLTERGLPLAISELVVGFPVQIDVRVRVTARLPSTTESTAFFVISEALANIAKHADADRAWVRAQLTGDTLVVEVGDSGRGGVDLALGSGVQGLADRVGAVGGRLLLSSPVGGPTVIRAEIPCL